MDELGTRMLDAFIRVYLEARLSSSTVFAFPGLVGHVGELNDPDDVGEFKAPIVASANGVCQVMSAGSTLLFLFHCERKS